MPKSKADRLIIILLLIMIIFSLFLYVKGSDVVSFDYPNKLFDDSYVHEIDLIIDDTESFFDNALEEEYIMADVNIDGELFEDVGLRFKGNNSLNLTNEYGLCRYSFKIEFDHFHNGYSYHGLDKLSLDAAFQDNSYLKSKLTYEMFEMMEVYAPLTSFAYISINGNDFGLYLAIEEIEDSFLARNFGYDHGQLYKPDYRNFEDANLDIGLNYIGDDVNLYPGIFENARTNVTLADKKRLIKILKAYHENDFSSLDIDMILKNFVIQIFTLNWDGYIGHTGHNYFLYEDDGKIMLLPWDFNLAYGTYAYGMSEPIRDSAYLINFPINTPVFKEVMFKRPLYHLLMKNDEIFNDYHEFFAYFIDNFIENDQYKVIIMKYAKMIEPYVKKDPSAFCSYEDHKLAVETLMRFCELRSQSIKGQLEGKYPITLADYDKASIEVDIDLRDLGDFDDLTNSKNRQGSLYYLRNILTMKMVLQDF